MFPHLENKEKVKCIHLSYGQLNEKSELTAVKKIVDHFDCELDIVQIKYPITYRKKEILCRNAFFILSAASFDFIPKRISIGIHSGTEYYDCTLSFVKHCQNILDGYFSGTIRLEAPFVNNSKENIFQYSIEKNIPLDLTYSCIEGNQPCGTCLSCTTRRKLFENK